MSYIETDLQPQLLNYISKLKNRLKQLDGDETSSFEEYLLVKQKANQQAGYYNFNTTPHMKVILNSVVYNGFYSGRAGLARIHNTLTPVSITNLGFNRVEVQPINYQSITNFQVETFSIPRDEIAIFQPREDGYGLTVLGYQIENYIYSMWDIYFHQVKFLNRRLKVQLPSYGDLTTLQDLLDLDTPITYVPSGVQVEPFDFPPSNLSEIFAQIQNVDNWLSYQLLNLPSPYADIKERDVTATQNVANLNLQSNMTLQLARMDAFLEEVKDFFNLDVTYSAKLELLPTEDTSQKENNY